MENDTNNESGITITTPVFVFLIFLILKLTHVIDWKWIWVASPFWIPFAVAIAIIVLSAAVSALITLIEYIIHIISGNGM